MNLHNIVSGYVGTINPFVTASIQKSSGYTTAADGTRTPTYLAPISISVQLQALQYNDLMAIDGLNIQGERYAIYVNGTWEGTVRADGSGGDLITLPDGSIWLVVFVFENWGYTAGWSKLCVTRQL
jgi:hypothetical protein